MQSLFPIVMPLGIGTMGMTGLPGRSLNLLYMQQGNNSLLMVQRNLNLFSAVG